MTAPAPSEPSAPAAPSAAQRLRRFAPLALVVMAAGVVIAMGWHRHLSLEGLVRHRDAIDALVAANQLAAVAAFVGVYIAAVTLSLPGAVFLTIAGGLLFGTLVGGAAAIVGGTIGATLLFLIARSAIGGWLVRRAGRLAERLADGFRRDAFYFILFLRLVPLFPFWIINLVAALAGVGLAPFVLATAVGIIPGTFAFAFLGAGLDSAVAAQAADYKTCLADGRTDCRVDFDLSAAATPELIAALVVLGFIALVPVALRRFKLMPKLPSL